MDSNLSDSAKFAVELIRCPSVTPAEAGALSYLQSILEPAGFKVDRQTFSDSNSSDVENLFATFGSGGPHLLFAGHTDVVPAGAVDSWTHGPFEGVISNGVLFGRGAVDMKGAIASFSSAAMKFLEKHSNDFGGKLSFLITGDEEGPAINGTAKMLKWCEDNGEKFDACVVGEPTNPEKLGDAIKVGRRGSLSAALTVIGKQGHVAYPEISRNPIPDMVRILSALGNHELDGGNPLFQPSNLEITTIDTGNPAHNVIPESVQARFNVRFNDIWSGDSLKSHLSAFLQQEANKFDANLKIEFDSVSGESFLTKDESLISTLSNAIQHETGLKPELSTGGGTSDARIIKDYCPVVEFGLVNQTIHQVDERVPLEDLDALERIYFRFLETFFGLSNQAETR